MRIEGHGTRMWERRDVYVVFLVRLEGKRPLGRPRLRWDGIIKDFCCGCMNCFDLAQE